MFNPDFSPGSAAIGGVLIGAAAVLLARGNGRMAGVSGIINSVRQSASGDGWWRGFFLVGLVAGGYLATELFAGQSPLRQNFSPTLLIIAGLLVGFGTRMGSGCTSGHGVCGIARLSLRSVVATLVFMTSGMLTATLMAQF